MKLKDVDHIICYYENWLLTTENDGSKFVVILSLKLVGLTLIDL